MTTLPSAASPDRGVVDTAERRRIGPRWLSWALGAAATGIWAVAVLTFDLERRVLDNWESTVTMLFGSFLSGSSPVGGGAVAFPVFTKGLGVPGPVARTFGLSIQAVGMTMATIAIFLSGRRYHRRAAAVGSVAAVTGFLAVLFVLGQPDQLFWPSLIGSAWVKATFSIVLATTSLTMVLHLRHGDDDHQPLLWNRRLELGLVAVTLAGGVLAGLTGTGTNILAFLFLVTLADVLPKTALPTAIIIMTAVSLVGFCVFGLLDGQLSLDVVGDRVVSVGGVTADMDAANSDLLGLWLAAIPVVVWGAPLGSLAASLIREHHLVSFVAVLAGVEVITTFVLVSELRTDRALIAYLVVGLLVMPAGLAMLRRHRRAIFGQQRRDGR